MSRTLNNNRLKYNQISTQAVSINDDITIRTADELINSAIRTRDNNEHSVAIYRLVYSSD